MELDKTKFYISPAKEIVSVFIDDEWKQFVRTDIINSTREDHLVVDKNFCPKCSPNTYGNYMNSSGGIKSKCFSCGLIFE